MSLCGTGRRRWVELVAWSNAKFNGLPATRRINLRIARIPPEANASVKTSRLTVSDLGAEQSIPPFLPGSLLGLVPF